jgi:hypothetical protein
VSPEHSIPEGKENFCDFEIRPRGAWRHVQEETQRMLPFQYLRISAMVRLTVTIRNSYKELGSLTGRGKFQVQSMWTDVVTTLPLNGRRPV